MLVAVRSAVACRQTPTMPSSTSEVEHADEQQERAGHRHADEAADLLHLAGFALTTALAANAMAIGEHEHDGRVAEREEEADAERPLALLQQEADGVVDRRDVVGVERVAQPEHVGDEAEADERRMGARVVEVQAPARDVQGRDEAVEAGEPPPLARREREARFAPRAPSTSR